MIPDFAVVWAVKQTKQIVGKKGCSMLLENKVALITGAASGIGRATALQMASEGARVIVSDVDESGGAETVAMIESAGGTARFVACDVSQSAQVEALINATLAAFGSLHILVNNAGVGGAMVKADQIDEATWDQVMNVNVKGVWLCTKYALPHVLKTGVGCIVNIASLAGLVGYPNNSVYGASKHAVVGFTRSVALEYARLGLRVNAVCPGYTDTPMVNLMVEQKPRMADIVEKISPMKRLGRVEEIAEMIVFLASDRASFINGQAIAVDGGASSG